MTHLMKVYTLENVYYCYHFLVFMCQENVNSDVWKGSHYI